MDNRKLDVEVTALMNCGCGFKTQESKDAIAHARITGHQLEFHGKITRADKVNRIKETV